jgi:hypothetical protein
MIKKIIAMAVMTVLAGCSFYPVSKEANPSIVDIVPIYGEYKPVTYSQTIIEELVDADNNVNHVPVNVMSGATYWKDGYYVVPNIFFDETKSCVDCLVNFVKAEAIDRKQGITDSKIEWRERQDGEYTFSGWIGRNNVTYYSYIIDMSQPVTGAKFVQNRNTIIEPMTRTLHVGSVTPAGIMAGAPLFSVDQKIIGMTMAFDNLTIDSKNTVYISKSEIEKDWAVFQKSIK